MLIIIIMFPLLPSDRRHAKPFMWFESKSLLVLAFGLFLCLAPIFVDMYNTLNQRAFLDLMLEGNPYRLAFDKTMSFQGREWILDWPYPPITLLVDLPAWAIYRVMHSEALYQLVFKLPFFLSAIATSHLMARSIAEKQPFQPRTRLGDIYLLNPSVICLTTIAGGFDILAACLLFWAWCLFMRGSHRLSGLAIGIAGALRLYPFILVSVGKPLMAGN